MISDINMILEILMKQYKLDHPNNSGQIELMERARMRLLVSLEAFEVSMEELSIKK